MATGTRSLPTDSPVPYFQPIERGHMSEGALSHIESQRAVFSRDIQMSPCTTNVPSGGVKHHPVTTESDGLSTYMGLDDYDTLFEARHGRGALDNVPRTSGEVITTSSIGITPTTLSTGMIVYPRLRWDPLLMTERMLTALDGQMALSTEVQKPKGSLTDNIGTTGQLACRHQAGESST